MTTATKYPPINVPDHVDNEAAYIAAAHRRIDAMRARGAEKKRKAWLLEGGEPRVIMYAEILNEAYRERERGRDGFFGKMEAAIRQWGKLTERQEAAVLKILADNKIRAEGRAKVRAEENAKAAATSEWIGTIGKRQNFALTIKRVIPLPQSAFGPSAVNIMEDANGNVVVYMGGSNLGEAGDVILVAATVKKHDTRDGVKQTILQRPKLDTSKEDRAIKLEDANSDIDFWPNE